MTYIKRVVNVCGFDSVYVEHHQRRSQDEWLLHEYRDLESTLALKSIGVDISVAVLYENTWFD